MVAIVGSSWASSCRCVVSMRSVSSVRLARSSVSLSTLSMLFNKERIDQQMGMSKQWRSQYVKLLRGRQKSSKSAIRSRSSLALSRICLV
ncbi:Uncharacterised protein [Mycobacterium tuberculosis]|nr:Uncharacterised protein [Mycobacterium tuberculosis]CFR72132.1 Uncharacterised protein [Mycobacterium tuberculosis]CKS28747.1 Uncharacterised protein [Mycobacterium tuberculosis]CKS82413.1 Uncharacterised protein [Mycobacterium tuberculosis]SHA05250.1 Uncharacterised protein [Mycobacterium tuberculosis]